MKNTLNSRFILYILLISFKKIIGKGKQTLVKKNCYTIFWMDYSQCNAKSNGFVHGVNTRADEIQTTRYCASFIQFSGINDASVTLLSLAGFYPLPYFSMRGV
jgi:hypothetical protein